MLWAELTDLPVAEVAAAFLRCCGSEARHSAAAGARVFASRLAALRPFSSIEELEAAAATVWWRETPVAGWFQAFAAHPRIGDVAALRAKYGAAPAWSEGEQATAMSGSSEEVIVALAAANVAYESRFGHIFIICATGRSASEILAAVTARMANNPHEELGIAAAEQHKITLLRLRKLLEDTAGPPPAGLWAPAPSPPTPSSAGSGARAERRLQQVEGHLAALAAALAPLPASAIAPVAPRPPITTHVLDTALGRPAAGLLISLDHRPLGSAAEDWDRVGSNLTNSDGRAAVSAAGSPLLAGQYRMRFETGPYLTTTAGRGFYPEVTVEFSITPTQAGAGEHFHVPLLLAPYGYSTYRGS